MHINTTFLNNNQPKSILTELKTANKLPFSEILSSEYIANHVATIDYRERIYSPEITIWSFLSQVINADQSCQAAVARVIAFIVSQGRKPPSVNTAAYSKARSRLSEEILSSLARESAEQLEARVPSNWLWRNKHVKLFDGSTLSMPDTAENQTLYPQSTAQKPGIGFPIARIVAVISYATGAILDLAIGPYAGKGTGEQALLRQLMHVFKPGDVALADCCYASYFIIATLMKMGVDVVFPIHQGRHTVLRQKAQSRKKDHVVCWQKSKKPEWMDKKTYDEFPDEIKIREVLIQNHRPGFRSKSRIIVTTFLDSKFVSKHDLSLLYDCRWHVELDLRSIKDTMCMGILRGKKPTMVRKEIWAHILAYNLIRKIMAQAASIYDKKPRELSFKFTIQIFVAFRQVEIFSENHKYYSTLLKAIAQKNLNNKPGRQEPRRVKRRPKSYPLLIKPRFFYHQEVMRNA